jgi:predicted dehydrogenase
MTFVSPDTLDVAVIGLGRMGLRHVQAVKQIGMRICGVADVSASAVKTACETYGLDSSVGFTDVNVMFRAVRPAAVVIATTAPSHRSYVLAAAEAKARYILCEKPMATSLADAVLMDEACKRHGATLAINHQMQFMPHYARVKALVGSNELGPLSSILMAGSNFGLAMNGSHYFEMFRYISGETIKSVCAWLEEDQLSNPRGPEFEDRSGRLLAKGSGRASMFVDFSAQAGHGLQLVFICRYGQIMLDELSGEMRVVARQAEYRDLPTARYGMPADSRSERVEPTEAVAPTAAVWSAMLSGRPFPDASVGLHALRCCIAAHVSHEAGGKAVQIDDPIVDQARNFKWA